MLFSTCLDGKGHHGYTRHSSSGVLIKEDEQKTIAGSLLPESQTLECGLKKNGVESLGTGEGWELKIRKRGKYFIMLMKERENLKHSVFLK